MSAYRPILLVDVDGVLNPWGLDIYPDGFVAHDLFPGDDEPVRLFAAHGDWLRDLSGIFELAWATAWGETANDLLSPILGLPSLPVVPMPAVPFPPQAKVPAIASFVDDPAAAWIDDAHTDAAHQWAAARQHPTWLEPVDHTVGLTKTNVDHLIRWVDSLHH